MDLNRRQLLRFGTIALAGAGWLHARPAARADSCILLYMDGGPSHLDTFDLKPDAPEEVRGPFRSIATSLSGVRVCEHLPRVARVMHRLTQVRSVRHDETIHDPAVYQMLTGRRHPIRAGGLKVAPTDFPHLGSLYAHARRGAAAVMPPVIELPETMRMEARVLPGQGAGFLGPTDEPFRVSLTPQAEVVPPPFAPQLPVERMGRRARLRDRVESRLRAIEAGAFDTFQRQAAELLARPAIRHAFDLEREPAAVRERYGRHRHGQGVLLARRLVEAGARFVTVYWGREDQDWADGRGPRPANNPWDTHRNHFPLLKESLLPRADQTLSALVEDLAARGMLGRTLVLWMGDFGRTPRIDRKYASRDHWPAANTVLFAGGGVPAGRVLGRTDRLAAEVEEDAVSPADLTATVLRLLGVDPAGQMKDAEGRAHALSEGRAVGGLIG